MSLSGLLFGSGTQFGAYELTESDVETITEAAGDYASGESNGSTLLHIRPYQETKGFGGGEPERFARGFQRTDRGGETPTYSHEVWFHDRRLAFYISTPDADEVRDLIDTLYPSSDVTEVDRADALPSMEAGEFVGAAQLPLKMDCAYPIRFPGSKQPYTAPPYSTLLPKAVNERDERVMIQTVFTPVSSDWTSRGWFGSDMTKIAESKKQGEVVGEINPEIVQSPADKDTATDMHKQRGRPAYAVTIRVVAIGPDPIGVTDRVAAVADTFDEFDYDASGQGFQTKPLRGSDVRKELQRAAMRIGTRKGRLKRWVFGDDQVLTDRELGAVAHMPGSEVNVPEIDRSRTAAGPGVPADAPFHERDESRPSREGDTA